MKVNFVYHTPKELGSGFFGSVGLKRALESNGYLDYAFDQSKEFLDIQALRRSPIFFVRGFLYGRFPLVARSGNQFKATWQSESYYDRRGNLDVSTKALVKNQGHFNMLFTCADTDLDMYEIPTYFLPSWINTDIIDECGEAEYDGLGFVGSPEGREDFLDQDRDGIIKQMHTQKYEDSVETTRALARLISKFKFLVSPSGRCFNGMCGRAWEIMGCRRLCFQYLNPDTMFLSSKYFIDGVDIVYFKTFDELMEKYYYYLRNPEKADIIANNGYKKVREEHNQDVRAKYIVDCMEIEYKKWLEDQAKIPDEINKIYAEL